MAYATFLLVWVVPVITLLPFLRRGPAGGVGGVRARWAIPLTAAIAFLYTTPWDNYLVYRGVWGYGTERVIGTIGYVPVEEYLFFLLQPFLTGTFLLRVLERTPAPREAPHTGMVRRLGTGLFGVLSLGGAGLLLSGWAPGLYAGLILAWAGPVLAGMWGYAGPHLWSYRRALAWTLVPATLYLWIADAFAIRNGIWSISDRYSFDLDPLGLPVEEALFFLLTNVLCVFSVLTFLHGDRIQPFWKRDA